MPRKNVSSSQEDGLHEVWIEDLQEPTNNVDLISEATNETPISKPQYQFGTRSK